MVSLKHIKTAA